MQIACCSPRTRDMEVGAVAVVIGQCVLKRFSVVKAESFGVCLFFTFED